MTRRKSPSSIVASLAVDVLERFDKGDKYGATGTENGTKVLQLVALVLV